MRPDLLALVTSSASYPVTYTSRIVPARCSATELAAGVAALGADSQFVVAGAGGAEAQLAQSLAAGVRPLFHPGVTSSRVYELVGGAEGWRPAAGCCANGMSR